ncbi:MAG: hypothetical protein GTO18_14390 [Anaerolineales bacterium]|nr:hypothetical protein [Anaerolineales bacterium]
MYGAELKTPEFAYLLAAVNAQTVVGVDDPELFPADSSTSDAVLSAGREGLEVHGWLKPVEHSPNEFQLDSLLFEAATIVAAPDFIIATTHDSEEGERQLLLHYLSGGEIVELSATAERTYRIGVLLDEDALHERIAHMLRVTPSALQGQFRLSESNFTSILTMSHNGVGEDAVEILKSAGVDSIAGASFVAALGSPVSGQIVIISQRYGEIEAGRRALVFGEGDGAWMLKRVGAASEDYEVENCDADTIQALVTKWKKELVATIG